MSNISKTRMGNKCQECGCNCDSCVNNNSVHLHQEIEDLKRRLSEREMQVLSMESQILMHAKEYPNGEMQALRESLYFWQDKYDRLLESYRKLQKVNQGLEDKLLRIADKFENEKISLTKTVTDLTGKLTESQASVIELQQEAEQYRNDCNLAIRLLQCKPSQFMSHKLDSFPSDVQEHVQQYLNYRGSHNSEDTCNNKPGGKLIRVPIPTFPPTAVLYSLNKDETPAQETTNKPSTNYVSAAIMAKILEEREKERNNANKCSNCKELKNKQEQENHYFNDNQEFSIQIDQSLSSHPRFSSNLATIRYKESCKLDSKTSFVRDQRSKLQKPNNETMII